MFSRKWPRSKWAVEARKEMAKIAKAPRKASVPSRIMTAPGTPDVNGMNSGGGNGVGGYGAGGMGGGMGAGGMGGGSPF